VADEPEPELDPELEPIESPEPLVAEVARPVVFAAAESATSWPSPPRATFATPRATPSATRVVAPFPPAPTPSPFPLRREVGSSAFVSTLAKKDEPAKAKSQDKHKNKKNSKDEKAAKAKKGNKHKSKSTVTVQVKVTDKQRKHKKNRKK
jgi:hypothetical protein